jgi:hypothetical protein
MAEDVAYPGGVPGEWVAARAAAHSEANTPAATAATTATRQTSTPRTLVAAEGVGCGGAVCGTGALQDLKDRRATTST